MRHFEYMKQQEQLTIFDFLSSVNRTMDWLWTESLPHLLVKLLERRRLKEQVRGVTLYEKIITSLYYMEN